MPRIPKIALLLGAAVLLTGTTIAISAQFITAAIGGASALRYHQEGYLAELTDVLSALEGRTRSAEQRSASIEQVSTELRALHQCELARGCVSGRGGGEGPASRELERVLTGINAWSQANAELLGAQQARLDEARIQIEEARVATRERDEEAFAEAVTRAHAALSHARGDEGEVAFGGADALAESEYPELARLGERLLRSDTASAELDLDPSVPVFEALGPYEASVRYRHKVFMAHVLGVAVELLPLLMFLVILLSGQIRRDDEHDDFDDADHGFPAPGRLQRVDFPDRRAYPAE